MSFCPLKSISSTYKKKNSRTNMKFGMHLNTLSYH